MKPVDHLSAQVLVRLDTDLHDRLRARCHAEERSVSQTMRALVRRYVDGEIILPGDSATMKGPGTFPVPVASIVPHNTRPAAPEGLIPNGSDAG